MSIKVLTREGRFYPELCCDGCGLPVHWFDAWLVWQKPVVDNTYVEPKILHKPDLSHFERGSCLTSFEEQIGHSIPGEGWLSMEMNWTAGQLFWSLLGDSATISEVLSRMKEVLSQQSG